MAVSVYVRVVIALSAGGVKVIKWAQGPGVDAAVRVSRTVWDRYMAGTISDEQLRDELEAAGATMVSMATYSTTFDLRKLQVLFTRTSDAAVAEDDAVITFHFLKLSAGAPDGAWIAADFTAVEGALDTAWAAIKGFWQDNVTLDELRWYRAGPQRDVELGGTGRTGPPVRVVDRNVAGTSTATIGLPSQCAASVTEQCSDPKAWGRFYLPAPASNAIGGKYGRFDGSFAVALGNAFDTFYEAARTGGTPIVVYSVLKPVRPTRTGGTLPAKTARALTVDQLQIDDIPDVIRSRRWETPLLRLQRAIG